MCLAIGSAPAAEQLAQTQHNDASALFTPHPVLKGAHRTLGPYARSLHRLRSRRSHRAPPQTQAQSGLGRVGGWSESGGSGPRMLSVEGCKSPGGRELELRHHVRPDTCVQRSLRRSAIKSLPTYCEEDVLFEHIIYRVHAESINGRPARGS